MNPEQVRAAVNAVLEPGHFFVAGTARVRIDHEPREEAAWEIVRGHLLDASRTRQRRVFEAWNVHLESESPPGDPAGPPESAPVISIKWDRPAAQIHLTRNLLTYGWEAVEETPGVISTRPARKWVPERIATLELSRSDDPASLQHELQEGLVRAVVGTSRLGITSLESPLPSFSLGRFAYLPGRSPAPQPLRTPAGLVERVCAAGRSDLERSRLLELALRAAADEEVPGLTRDFERACHNARIDEDWIVNVVRTLFNNINLSPYTPVVDRLVTLLRGLAGLENGEAEGPAVLRRERVIDLLSFMLRQLVRHLTAFDLVNFHNRGANYPDALSLESLLRADLSLVERSPDEFLQPDSNRSRLRRRALRQAWLARKSYEGLPVPDAPTSPGENLRVLPEPFLRVPEEQILDPSQRGKRLFADEPAESLLGGSGRSVLQRSMDDLGNPRELRELGMALYLDRPLGLFKEPGEVDRTPLLSYEAFSRTVAARRLKLLHRTGCIDRDDRHRELAERLDGLDLPGVPVSSLAGSQRPGVVALEDAAQAAGDFLFLRTTRQSLQDFLNRFDWRALQSVAAEVVQWLFSPGPVLLIRTAPSAESALGSSPFPPDPRSPLLTAYDVELRPRLRLGIDSPTHEPVAYRESGGLELPAAGLRVLEIYGREPAETIRIPALC